MSEDWEALLKAAFRNGHPSLYDARPDAQVLAFPNQKRCSRCVFFTVDTDGQGVCIEYEEVVGDEAVAEICSQYEVR